MGGGSKPWIVSGMGPNSALVRDHPVDTVSAEVVSVQIVVVVEVQGHACSHAADQVVDDADREPEGTADTGRGRSQGAALVGLAGHIRLAQGHSLVGNREIVVVRNLLAGAVEVGGVVGGEEAIVGRAARERTGHTGHPSSASSLAVSFLVVE